MSRPRRRTDYKAIKLPNLKRFACRTEKDTPYHKFFRYLHQRLDPSKSMSDLQVACVCVTARDYKALHRLAYAWAKHTHKHWSARSVKEALMWLCLEIAPFNWQAKDKPRWARRGYAYVKHDVYRWPKVAYELVDLLKQLQIIDNNVNI